MNKIANRVKKYKVQMLVWTAYLFYESIIIGALFKTFGHPLAYLAGYMMLLSFFFFNARKGLPWAMAVKKHMFLRLSAILAVEMCVYILLAYLVSQLLIWFNLSERAEFLYFDYQYALSMAFRASLYLGFSFGYYYLLIYNKERVRNAELERQRFKSTIREQRMVRELSNARNAFLKAQINPHFLFNTLDFVYHHISITSAVAADAIINLAEMMRYALGADKDGEFIALGDEIEQVEHLLHLYQLRKDNAINIKFQYADNILRIRFIPLVLLTLVENMFKHGNLSDPDVMAYIRINLVNNEFSIETYNHIKTGQNQQCGAMGLQNIERRLVHAYGNMAKLHYFKTATYFNIRLTLPATMVAEEETSTENKAKQWMGQHR